MARRRAGVDVGIENVASDLSALPMSWLLIRPVSSRTSWCGGYAVRVGLLL